MKKLRSFHCSFRKALSTLKNLNSEMEDLSERYCYKPVLKWNCQVEEYFVNAYGADHFARISEALTHPSCYSCIRVNTLKTSADKIIEKLSSLIKQVEPENVPEVRRSRATGGEINFDASLKQNDLSTSLEKSSDEVNPVTENECFPISKCQLPGLDYLVFVKGSGPHRLYYGSADGGHPKEIVVSRKCAEAVLRGAQVYVPGVMACSAHVEKGDVVAISVAVEQPCADGGWGLNITRGTVLSGTETDPYYSERSGLYIGQGVTTMSRSGIFRSSEGIAVNMNNRVFNLHSFYDVLEGEIFLQNLPSIVTAHALDPQRGDRILDMCAAPGGKTTAIAILMKDEGEVVAADRSHNKVMDIQKLAAEMCLTCITTYKLDALKAVCRSNPSPDVTTKCSTEENNDVSDLVYLVDDKTVEESRSEDADEKNANGKPYTSKADIRKNKRRLRNGRGKNQSIGGRVEKSKGFPPNSFDRVLLDAPCSALGLRPRLFAGEETIGSLRNHAKYQRRMFDQAVQLVRPGGVIVYSTCTINPGENEALVRYALDTYKFLSLAPQNPRIGGPGLVGHHEFSDGSVEEWLRPGEEELVQRFDPTSPLDTIGFFIAKFSVGSKDKDA